jgi:hypothetical protein
MLIVRHSSRSNPDETCQCMLWVVEHSIHWNSISIWGTLASLRTCGLHWWSKFVLFGVEFCSLTSCSYRFPVCCALWPTALENAKFISWQSRFVATAWLLASLFVSISGELRRGSEGRLACGGDRRGGGGDQVGASMSMTAAGERRAADAVGSRRPYQ